MFRANSVFLRLLTLAGALSWLNGEALAARLDGSFSPLAAGSNVNLSIVGTMDWVHWGLGSATEINRKAGVTPFIGALTAIGANPVEPLETNQVGFSWSDGTPALAVTYSPSALFIRGLTNGFEFTTEATTSRRRLYLFAGAEAATGLLEALLSDGSAPGYYDEALASAAPLSNGVFVIDFASATPGETLTVRFTAQTINDATNGRVAMLAATLASNLSPAVQLSLPTNNATFFNLASVTLTAGAVDHDGSIQLVEFYQGSQKLGEVFDPPYTLPWEGVTSGSYILTARATDNEGATTVSAPVSITVLQNFAPTVVMTNPANLASFSVPTNLLLGATASDLDGTIAKVEFYRDNSKLGEVTSGPYLLVWTNALVGLHEITARATDNQGATRVSPAVEILVTQTGGHLTASPATVTEPVFLDAEGPADWVHWGLYGETSFNRKRGVAPQISNYSIIGNEPPYPYGDHANPYTWADGTPTAATTNTTTGVYVAGVQSGFHIQAPAGLTTNTLKLYVGAYAARGRLLAYLDDFSTPSVSDFSVNNAGNGPGTVYTLQYAATAPGTMLHVRFLGDGIFAGDGNVTLQAAALDTGNRPPLVSVTNPPSGATLPWPTDITLSVEATDMDGSITNLEFFHDGEKFGQVSVEPYSIVWSNATAGSHSFTAQATDDRGVTFHSKAAEFFVSMGGGSLRAEFGFPPAQTDLSSEGVVDWAHWGLSKANSFDHRSGATQRISDATRIGGQPKRYTDNFTRYSWTNGTPTPSASASATGVYVEGLSNGFQITAPADPSRRRLKVYVGLYGARSRFEASLSDGSARPFTDTSLFSFYGNHYRVYTLDYSSATPGQQLIVRHTAEEIFDDHYGNVTLQSATLTDLPPPRLANFNWDGSAMRFSFATLSYKSYLVQSSEVLPGTNWQTIAASPGTDLEVWVTNAPPTSPQQFYRVVEY